MDFIKNLKIKAVSAQKTIVFPEGSELRTLKAAKIINEEKIAKVVLIGKEAEITKNAADLDISLEEMEVIEPATSKYLHNFAASFYEIRKKKGITEEQALETMKDEVYFATMMVHQGLADGLVSGAVHSTGDTIRPALQIIKTKPGIKVVSSVFIMLVPDCEYGCDGMFTFGDCAVNIDPTSEELAEIAICSANTAKNLCGIEPKVAMLSFSTKGSAKHPYVDKVAKATQLVMERAPHIQIDGDIQVDAALVESVAKIKCPESKIAGKANVLIFPDLQSGNIGYKLVQRLGNAMAIGPFLQGIAKPVNDLSRGCSVSDIVDVATITAVQAAEEDD